MWEPHLRKLHRPAAAVRAPLLVLQALSGVRLSVDRLLGKQRHRGESVGAAVTARLWDAALVAIPSGAGGTSFLLLGGGAAVS